MVFEKVKEIISKQFDVDVETITENTSFMDDLNADSLDVVEVAMAMEGEFGIPEMSEDSVRKIATVGDLVNYVTAAME